jgi:hypothetical protein
MNTTSALAVAARIAELTEMITLFQVKYGKAGPDAPLAADARRLYSAIFDQQVAIARLLDSETLLDPLPRWPGWWLHQSAPDMAMVGEMAREANQLIANCAYIEAEPDGEYAHSVFTTQASIAGMLHPAPVREARRKARQRTLARSLSVN